ncbi:hypothetical protein ONZ45_g14045 [Pleurotus djamor]|nr:hypothetical protein ONZ45_g14045 [Pleurotus djamor]
MASTKAKLKAARDFIAKKDFVSARTAAQQTLDYDPSDYHAKSSRYEDAMDLLPSFEFTHYALKLLLHGSVVFDALLNLPPPDPTNPTSNTPVQEAVHNTLPTLEEIVSIIEAEESSFIEKEIAKRRTRLGAPSLDVLTKEVKTEVLLESELPKLYDEISSHPNATDEVRRAAEAKVLRRKLDLLQSLPSSSQREQLKDDVDKLVKGIVLLGIADELAWSMYFEWIDTETVEGYGVSQMQQYAKLFPTSNLGKVFSAFLAYHATQESPTSSNDSNNALALLMNGQAATKTSRVACHISAELYSREMDYPTAVKLARRGLMLLDSQESVDNKEYKSTRLSFNTILGVSLVNISPKFHSKASPILDQVLGLSPNNVACLLAKSAILSTAKEWVDAAAVLEVAVRHIPEDTLLHLFAQEELAWSRLHIDPEEDQIDTLERLLPSYPVDDKTARSRCSWRIGEGCRILNKESRMEAYRYYISALKADPTFAPAFTSLGTYYLEVAEHPDSARALKCFQKAVELDAREIKAAEYLALGFADDNAWNLVEVVARRVIEGEGSEVEIPGIEVEDDARPEVVWAWKAIGVVESNNNKYEAAIRAFHTVLRSSPEDYSSWLYLGEAYCKAGRYVAALNSFSSALKLRPGDWVCLYRIGQLKQQTGLYAEALSCFEAALAEEPSQVGVAMAQAQAYLDLGRYESTRGFAARAGVWFTESIKIALKATSNAVGLRATAWKVVGDALVMMSKIAPSRIPDADETYQELVRMLRPTIRDGLAKMIKLTLEDVPQPLELAVVVYDLRRSLASSDVVAAASSHYDYALALMCWMDRNSEKDISNAREEANDALTRALKQDITNDLYWTTLGDLEFRDRPKVAQHAYVKALEVNPKNAGVWAKLGLLYLYHGDVELALEALGKAHVLDPEYRLTWVAEALVAEVKGNRARCYALFEHSLSMKLTLPPADIWFAKESLVAKPDLLPPPSVAAQKQKQNLPQLLFTLTQYIQRYPHDPQGLQLYGFVCERLGLLDEADGALGQAIAILEAAYEESESTEVEARYAMVSVSLGRVKLGRGEYGASVEMFGGALGLLPETLENENDDDGVKEKEKERENLVLRFQCLLGCALACYKMGDVEEAMGNLNAAAQEVGVRGDVRMGSLLSCLQGQVLWMLGTAEYREHAKTSLLQSISTNGDSLALMQTLATMGILSDDENLIDAAISEIVALPLDEQRKLDPCGDINHLLIQNHLAQNNLSGAFLTTQKAVVISPVDYEMRREMARLVIQSGHVGTALSMFNGLASESEDPEEQAGTLTLNGIALALYGKGGTGVAQRAVMLAPWKQESWMGVLYAKSV